MGGLSPVSSLGMSMSRSSSKTSLSGLKSPVQDFWLRCPSWWQRARAELGPFAPVLLVAGKFPGAGRRRCPGHFPDLFQVSNRRWQNPGGAARTASRASAISLRALGFGGSRVVHPVQDAVVRKRVMLVPRVCGGIGSSPLLRKSCTASSICF